MTPISVEERLPDNSERVMVYDGKIGWHFGSYHPDAVFDPDDWTIEDAPGWYRPVITHWMPLPPPPTHE